MIDDLCIELDPGDHSPDHKTVGRYVKALAARAVPLLTYEQGAEAEIKDEGRAVIADWNPRNRRAPWRHGRR